MATTAPRLVTLAAFEYQHIADSYTSEEEEFDLRGLHYILFEVYDNGSVHQTFVHNGARGEFRNNWYSSTPVPGAAGHVRVASSGQEIWCPTRAAFSFLGPRGRVHPLKIGPFSKKGNRKQSGRFWALHCGRNARGPRYPAIPSNTPWAVLWRITPFQLARGEEEYAEIIHWIRTRPPLPPREDVNLAVLPSHL